MLMNRSLIPLTLVALVAAASCSSGSAGTGGTMSGQAGMSGMPGMSMGPEGSGDPGTSDGATAAGVPGDPASVMKVVRIDQLDQLSFDPASVVVRVGDTVRFVVTNTGAIPHEFVLGNQAFQDQHEQEMSGMSGSPMPDEAGSISVDPGATEDVVWRFTRTGTLQYGCHLPGHYAAGMKGEIAVTA